MRVYPVGNPLLTGVNVTSYWQKHPLTDAEISQVAAWIAELEWPQKIHTISVDGISQWATRTADLLCQKNHQPQRK